MNIYCTACGASIPASNVNIQQRMAQCARCGTVFRFGVTPAEQVGGNHGSTVATRLKNIDIAQYDGELVISRRWGDWRHVALIIFASLWLAGTAFFTIIGLIVRSWSMLFFLVLFFAAGVFIAYIALAGLRNRTTIRVGNGALGVKHGPIPWPGNTRLNTAAIDQLTTREVKTYNWDGPNRTTYQLIAVTRDGREKELLRGLESADEIHHLEQVIARYLRVGTLPMQRVYVR